MLTTDELFNRMMELSGGNPNELMSLDQLGGRDSLPILRALVGEGRAEACSMEHWRLPVHAIGETVVTTPEDEDRLIADADAMLPPNQGWFKIKALVTQKGWTYPAAIAAALSLARQGRLEEGSLGNFRLLAPNL